jgi:hypothetical protein
MNRCLPMGNSVSGSTIPAFRRCLPSRCLANDFSKLVTETCVREPLYGSELFRRSDLMSQYCGLSDNESVQSGR